MPNLKISGYEVQTTSKRKSFLLMIKRRKEIQIEGTNGKEMKINPHLSTAIGVNHDQISAKNEERLVENKEKLAEYIAK